MRSLHGALRGCKLALQMEMYPGLFEMSVFIAPVDYLLCVYGMCVHVCVCACASSGVDTRPGSWV